MPDPIALLEAQSAATGKVVQSVTDDQMAQESPGCPGWTVKQVLAHLTAGAEMFEGVARGSISGATWMEERTRRIAAANALSPEALRRRYAETDASLVSIYKSLSAEQLQEKRQHPALGEIPVGQFLHMRISEAAIHAWDLQAAADPSATLECPARGPVTEQMAGVLPMWFDAGTIAGLQRTYRFMVDGSPRTLTIAGGKAAWTGDASPDATLTLSGGDFLLLITGRLSSERLIDSGRAQVTGDVDAARQFSTLFKAYGGR